MAPPPQRGPGVPEQCVATTLAAVARRSIIPTTACGRCRHARRYQDGPRALRGHSRRYWGGRLEVYPDVVTCDKGGVANYQKRYIPIGGGAVPPTGPGVPERCVATTLVAVARHPSVPTTTRGRCRDARRCHDGAARQTMERCPNEGASLQRFGRCDNARSPTTPVTALGTVRPRTIGPALRDSSFQDPSKPF